VAFFAEGMTVGAKLWERSSRCASVNDITDGKFKCELKNRMSGFWRVQLDQIDPATTYLDSDFQHRHARGLD